MPRGAAESDSLIDSEVYQKLKVYSKNMLMEALQEKKVLEEIQKQLEADEIHLCQKLAELEKEGRG